MVVAGNAVTGVGEAARWMEASTSAAGLDFGSGGEEVSRWADVVAFRGSAMLLVPVLGR